MLTRRLAWKITSTACQCRCHIPSASASLRSPTARTISSSSSRWLPAAAQLAEPEPVYEPSIYHTSSSSYAPPPVFSAFSAFNNDRPIIQLPEPLPSDAPASPSDPRSSLYPTTGVIDQLSMIAICLRRPEHTPRAYQLFRQLLDASKNGSRRLPDADVWGRVTEGTARLGNRAMTKDPVKAETWRRRALMLVERWEMENKTRGLNVVAGREKSGIKVYQGYFVGTVSSGDSLDALVPYLVSENLEVRHLLDAVPPSDMPLAYEAVTEIARRFQIPGLEEKICLHGGVEKEKREFQAREKIQEVKPVLDTAGKNILRREPKPAMDTVDPDAPAPQARFSISNLRNALDELAQPSLPRERQFALENASYLAASLELQRSHDTMKKMKTAVGGGVDDVLLQRDRLQSWMHEWHGALKGKLASDLVVMREKLLNTEADPAFTVGTHGMKEDVLTLYLTLLPADKLALITIIEVMRQAGSHGISDGMKALRGMLAVGKAVETEYRAETIKSVAGVDSPQWLRTLDPHSQKPTRQLVGSVWRKLGKQLRDGEVAGAALDQRMEEDLKAVWTPAWSQMTHIGLGSYLVQSLLEVAKVSRTGTDPETQEKIVEEQPAFSHGYDYMRGKKLGVIRLNPIVASRLSKDNISVMIHPKHLPMLVEPRAWRSHDDGGYLVHQVEAMRYKDSSEQKSYLREASAQGHMEPVYHGLDVLSSTPWTINRRVFDVVLQAWNDGDAIADIPASDEKAVYDLPPKDDSGDPAQRTIYVEKAKAALAASKKDHNERCKFNYNIEIARAYLHDTFYLPHSMDFRGRAYPIPPHLSPVGDDLCRGLLSFGVKKPLGRRGLRWLQIQLANVYGFDKASFDERARFAQDREAEIFDSADRPLDGNRWWLKAEDPWQCLATCFDLAAALRSPNPQLYESALPVHQDGTCNGMQHYAALGGDVRGAKAVNLENGDRPADIYTGVADVVNKVIEQDKAKGHVIAQHINGPLGRKVVKQTVMTTVYGVTYIGARDQIARQLQARGDISPEQVFVVSGYIAKTVLSCIGDIFSGAKDIMDWLTTSARLIARSIPPDRVGEAVKQIKITKRSKSDTKPKSRIEKELMTSVIWTTPLGLPVVQPYRKAVKKQIMTSLQSVYISDPNAPSEVSPQKQATAFPPNFIHSLDATHMLLTATKCKQANITFASVHDSYWTHASTVVPMSELIREMFINLHSQDLVGQLRSEFLDRYGDYRIAVKSAKAISTSQAVKRTKDIERRKQMASILGEEIDSPVVTAAVEGDETDVNSALSEVDEMDDLDSASEGDVPASSSRSENAGLALTSADLASLKEKRGAQDVPEETVADQRFVRFSDVLPPPPARGSFDVSRIKDSAYFFS